MQYIEKNTLRIVELNVNSLISIKKRHELQDFLKTNNPDIVLLCETCISEKHKIQFNNYNFHRNDAIPGTLKRGTGILIRKNINSNKINTTNWNLDAIECTAIQITTTNSPINIISIYRNCSNRQYFDIGADMKKIINENRTMRVIIGGDYNARHEFWGNLKRCKHGINLYNWYANDITAEHVKIAHSLEPTYYTPSHTSTLDFFFISNQITIIYPNQQNSLEILDFPSNHRAVALNIKIDDKMLKEPPIIIENFAKTNWTLFRNKVDEELLNVQVPSNYNMSTVEIDNAVDSISEAIRRTIDTVVPKMINKQRSIITLPDDLQRLIDHKNRLRRRWQRNRYDYNEFQLRSEINCLTKIIQDRIKIVHENQWTETLKNVKLNNKTFKTINRLTNRITHIQTPALEHNGTLTNDDTDKANVLAYHFEEVHKKNLDIGDPVYTNNVNQNVKNQYEIIVPIVQYNDQRIANPAFGYDPQIHLTSVSNVVNIIKSRNNKKSSGNDNIPNSVIRKLGKRFHTTLTILFNQMYNIAYFPKAWKIAKVIAIPKPGKPPAKKDNYRPIALLPCISKLYERLIKEKICYFCEENNVFPKDQYGFVERGTTIHPLVKLQNDITVKLNAKIPTIAVSLDVAKAFDTTWTEGLIFKMKNVYNFDNHLCGLVYHYLTDRTFYTEINKKRSDTLKIAAGVPQGGVLSATLFIIYIADMPKPEVHVTPIQRLQYADDTLLYISAKNIPEATTRINTYINQIESYHKKWKIKLNPTKCEVIVFKGPNKTHSKQINESVKKVIIKVGQQAILPQKTLKYLGITFQKEATHYTHQKIIREKANKCIRALAPVLRKLNGLSKKIKMICYKQLIRPIITYGFACWSTISSAQMEKLRVLERKCLRMCINYRRDRGSYKYMSNKQTYEYANTKRIDIFMIKAALKFFNKLEDWNTPLILDDLVTDPDYMNDTRNKYKPPTYLRHLHRTGQIKDDEPILLYHRRFNNRDGQSLVYNTSQ